MTRAFNHFYTLLLLASSTNGERNALVFWAFCAGCKIYYNFHIFLCSSMVHVKGVVNCAVHYGKEYVYTFQLQIVQNVNLWNGEVFWVRNVASKMLCLCNFKSWYFFLLQFIQLFELERFFGIPNKIAWVYWCTGIENNLIWMLLANKVWRCKSFNGKSLVFGMHFRVLLKRQSFLEKTKCLQTKEDLTIVLNAKLERKNIKFKWRNKFKSKFWFLWNFLIWK